MKFAPRFHFNFKSRAWPLGFYSVLYALAMLALGGATFTKLYAPSPYHRFQADALLKGHLYIGDSIEQIQHDLAWHDGEVNHVWGLGVGMWLVPFEALWRLCGQKWFPDRIALGVAFGLLAWYSGGTAWRLADRSKSPVLGIGFVWLILLCPAVWTLNQGGRLIYEETSLYACLVSLGILVATVRVACFGRASDFFICAVLAAMAPIVRPTHGIYGLAGMLVCSAILLSRRGPADSKSAIQRSAVESQSEPDRDRSPGRCSPAREESVGTETQAFLSRSDCCAQGTARGPQNGRHSRRFSLVLGNIIFVAGLVFLALTNWLRFGSPLEFGHRLTATPGIIVYMTRIDNPMREAAVGEAAVELFGSLFLSNRLVEQRNAQREPTWWQAPHERWRDPYMTTYDLSWAVVCLAGFVGGVWWLGKQLRRGRRLRHMLRRPGLNLSFGTAVWAGMTTAGLCLFFLRLPVFSSRYLLDFAPAFVACALLVWLRFSHWVSLVVLAGWLGYELLTAQLRPAPTALLTRDEVQMELRPAVGKELGEYSGNYSVTNHPGQTEIAYNGYGWNKEHGEASHIVSLAIDRPEFVEMLVGPRLSNSGDHAVEDTYRAMIDNQFLPLREVREEGENIRVTFDVPERIRRRAGDELLFLCFSKSYEPQERASRRVLHSVRWRDE
jgi:hypothetical protein